MLVKNILDDMDLTYRSVELGMAELDQPITKAQKETLGNLLKIWRLTLIDNSREILVEKIKNSIINMIHNDNSVCAVKTSRYLSNYLNYNYTYLANVFSEETGTCLRDFIIAHRIEKVKEMLIHETLSITEIAWKLNYSSVAHLSNQFTKITGCSPREFKKSSGIFFTPLEKVGMLEMA